jgi:hypothetical protein
MDVSLLRWYKRVEHNIIVRRRFPTESSTNKLQQRFALFNDAEHLLRYLGRVPPGERDIYEIISTEQEQKPRFDIDVSLKGMVDVGLTHEYKDIDTLYNDICTQLLAAINTVLNGNSATILKYTSHGTNKRSAHIILNHVKHKDSLEAKQFYQRCIPFVSEKLRPFIDHAVYGKLQNFRLLYCMKYASGRMKVLSSDIAEDPCAEARMGKSDGDLCAEARTGASDGDSCAEAPTDKPDDTAMNITDFHDSLITYVADCIYLDPKTLAGTVPESRTRSDGTDDTLKYHDLGDAVLALLAIKYELDVSQLPFTVRDTQDSMVLLRRTAPSYCELCGREHDAENPYVVLRPNDDRGVYAYYYCRRAVHGDKDYNMPLGPIDCVLQEDDSKTELTISKSEIVEAQMETAIQYDDVYSLLSGNFTASGRAGGPVDTSATPASVALSGVHYTSSF